MKSSAAWCVWFVGLVFLSGCNQFPSLGGSGEVDAQGSGAAQTKDAGQASLTIGCGSSSICNATNTEWELGKTGEISGNQVTWSISTTKGSESHAILTFDGTLTVTNTGTANATIGNIVVNLQRKVGKNYVTASSVIADGTAGDRATRANICSGASSEALSGFSENASSIQLEFNDETTNTVFSLVPQKTIAPGEAVSLSYTAKYDATLLRTLAGEVVRLEAIVTFGNAGARGGSGAVCTKVDANGNGVISTDEANVRSVPCRTTVTIPSLERSNASVTVSDDGSALATSGSLGVLGFFTDLGEGTGVESSSESFIRSLTASVDPGEWGGSVTNCAALEASTPPTCNPAVRLRSCDTQTLAGITVENPGFSKGDFCTYTQGGWGSKPKGNNPGSILALGFIISYPGGVEIGIPGTAGYSMKFSSASSVEGYLPAGGTSTALTKDLLNPTKSSAGVFGGQVLAFRLNADFGRLGLTAGTSGSWSGLILQNTGTSLDGKTVGEILAIANTALGGGELPPDLSYSGLNDIVTHLNEGFDNCNPSDWAQRGFLRRP